LKVIFLVGPKPRNISSLQKLEAFLSPRRGRRVSNREKDTGFPLMYIVGERRRDIEKPCNWEIEGNFSRAGGAYLSS